MILKINFYFQLLVIVVLTIWSIVDAIFFKGWTWAVNSAILGILHIISFTILIFHPLSRKGNLLSNWTYYFVGVILTGLLIASSVNIGVNATWLVFPYCWLLGYYFVYNTYQLWKESEYDRQ